MLAQMHARMHATTTRESCPKGTLGMFISMATPYLNNATQQN